MFFLKCNITDGYGQRIWWERRRRARTKNVASPLFRPTGSIQDSRVTPPSLRHPLNREQLSMLYLLHANRNSV